MSPSRRLGPAIAAISLILALSVLVALSLGEDFKNVMIRENWPMIVRIKQHVEDSEKWRRITKDIDENIEDAFDTVVTITVCTPFNILPTSASSPPNGFPAALQNLTGSLDAGPDDLGLKNTASFSGYTNQPYPSNVDPTDCSKCTDATRVANTSVSTTPNIATTPVTSGAAVGGSVITNLRTSVAPRYTNTTVAITSAKPIVTDKSFSESEIVNTFSFAVICPNGVLAKRQQDCLLSPASSALVLSPGNFPASTTSGSTPNPARSTFLSQTPFRSFWNTTNLVSSTTSVVVSIPLVTLSSTSTGSASPVSVKTIRGPPFPNVTSSTLSSANLLPSTVSASNISSISLLPNITKSSNTAPRITFLGVFPSGNNSLLSVPNSLSSSTLSLLSSELSLQDLHSGIGSTINFVSSSTLPVVPLVSAVVSSPINNIDSAANLDKSTVSQTQGLVQSMTSDAAAILDSALSTAEMNPGNAVSNADAVATSTPPTSTLFQGFLSSGITPTIGSGPAIVTSTPIVINIVSSSVNSVIDSIISSTSNSLPSTGSIVATPALLVSTAVIRSEYIIPGSVRQINSLSVGIRAARNVIPALLGYEPLKETADPMKAGLPLPKSVRSTVTVIAPAVTTVTQLVSVVTVFLPDQTPGDTN